MKLRFRIALGVIASLSPAFAGAGEVGFSLCGAATEFPGANSGYARFALFTLNPGGLITRSTSSGYFCFDSVEPGSYTISVREYQGAPTSCTTHGCWDDTPVTVVDASISLLIVMRPLPTPTPAKVTVSVCYSEFPGSSCSPLITEYGHPLQLQGPIPTGSAREPDELADGAYRFYDVASGAYVARTDGCNPFGCWLDTPVFVRDQDVVVKVHQVGGQTPTPVRSPTPTSVPVTPCLGDWNGDGQVTIEELIGAVANAVGGCASRGSAL